MPSKVDVSSGTVRLQRTGTHSSEFFVDLGSRLIFGNVAVNNTLQDGTTFTGSGWVQITESGILTIPAGVVVTSSANFGIGFDSESPLFPAGFVTGAGELRTTAEVRWATGGLRDLALFRNQ